jgi:CHAD domain-containing protein
MNAFKKYLKKRKKAIDFLLGKPRWSYASVTFHKLRVEIKKLNAFFDLIKFCSKDFKREKMFKPFRLLFRQAGKVRELQVEEEMLKKYFENNFIEEYRKNLKTLRLSEQAKYFSVANEKFFASLKKRFDEVKQDLTKIDDEKVNRYIEDRRHRIEMLISQKTLKSAEIHTLRKRLKRFNYNRRLLDLKKTNGPSAKKDVLLRLLGKWHDCQVIIRHIQSAEKAVGINQEELSQLEEIEARVSSGRVILLNEINETIPESEFFVQQLR